MLRAFVDRLAQTIAFRPSFQVDPNAEQLEKDSAALSPEIAMDTDLLTVPASSAVGVADRGLDLVGVTFSLYINKTLVYVF